MRLGQTMATPGALEALERAGENPAALLSRHASGDWGEVSAEDKAVNDAALGNRERVLSAYTLRSGVKVWVITEWDRSCTTILLPEDY